MSYINKVVSGNLRTLVTRLWDAESRLSRVLPPIYGMMAYMTHLLETDPVYRTKYHDIPLLRTYMSPDTFITEGQMYVKKPTLGRLSSNIQIFNGDGVLTSATEGVYGEGPFVYQEYCEPRQVGDRGRFIGGVWMAPTGVRQVNAEPATFCIREFDGEVLQLSNERFIPHILE